MSDAALDLGLFVLTVATNTAHHSCRAAVVLQSVCLIIAVNLSIKKALLAASRATPNPAFHQLASRNLGPLRRGCGRLLT